MRPYGSVVRDGRPRTSSDLNIHSLGFWTRNGLGSGEREEEFETSGYDHTRYGTFEVGSREGDLTFRHEGDPKSGVTPETVRPEDVVLSTRPQTEGRHTPDGSDPSDTMVRQRRTGDNGVTVNGRAEGTPYRHVVKTFPDDRTERGPVQTHQKTKIIIKKKN